MKLIQPDVIYVADESEQLDFPQIWKCRCGKLRQWGFGPSIAPKEHPFLFCDAKGIHVRHTFAGLQTDGQ